MKVNVHFSATFLQVRLEVEQSAILDVPEDLSLVVFL